MSEEPDFIYSGRVLKDGIAVSSEEFLWIYINRKVNDGKTLQIQSTSALSVKIEIKLTEQQADSLYRCLHNALRRWQGKEP